MNKILIIVIISFLGATNVIAQECDYITDETDPFTKKTIKEVSGSLVNNQPNANISFSLMNKEGNRYLIFRMEYTAFNSKEYVLVKPKPGEPLKTKLLLLTNTDEVLTLFLIDKVETNKLLSAFRNLEKNDPSKFEKKFIGGTYWIGDNEFQKLKRASINKARINFFTTNYDFEIVKPNYIRNNIECIQ